MKTSGTINKCKKEIKTRLGKKASGEAIVHAIDVFHRHTDQLLRQRLKDMPVVKFACEKGCDLCCHLRIEVLPPEAFRITAHIKNLPLERQKEHRERLEKHAKYAFEKTYRDYQSACPFLAAGGVCSIYTVRPRICRTHLSTRRSACETPGNAQLDAVLQQVEDTLALQVIDLYKTRSLIMNPAEIGQAVLLALTDETTQSRWLSGEETFSRLPEGITL